MLVLALLESCARPRAPEPHDPIARNAACAKCHVEIADEWRASLHHASYDDPIFLASYAREPARFCVGCHAPEDHGDGRPTAFTALGTACTSCHEAPHDERVAKSGCGGCHEFSFPGREASPKLEDKMQRTLAEHASSDLSGVTCASCHMPTVNGHKSHRFGGGQDPAWLRSAIDVRVAKDDDQRVTITVAPAHVGHAVPTGDLFRRIVVGLETVDASGEVTRRDVKPMGREFSIVRGERVEIADNRPGRSGATSSSVTLTMGEGRGRWFVGYQRVLGQAPGDVEIAQDLRVMEGWIE